VNSQLYAEAVRARSHELALRAQREQALVYPDSRRPEPREPRPARARLRFAWLPRLRPVSRQA